VETQENLLMQHRKNNKYNIPKNICWAIATLGPKRRVWIWASLSSTRCLAYNMSKHSPWSKKRVDLGAPEQRLVDGWRQTGATHTHTQRERGCCLLVAPDMSCYQRWSKTGERRGREETRRALAIGCDGERERGGQRAGEVEIAGWCWARSVILGCV
jgi:hypothetical protein